VSTIIIQDWNIKVAYFFASIWPNFRVALTYPQKNPKNQVCYINSNSNQLIPAAISDTHTPQTGFHAVETGFQGILAGNVWKE
jgi:hypothetical protein